MLSKSSLPPFSSRSPLCSGFPGRSEGPLPRGWFSSGMHLALANGCGGSESASSQWARKVLNGFACFSQRFSLLLREDCTPGSCCHFTPDPRRNSWSRAVLAYSRTASLRTNLFFFPLKKIFIGVYLLYSVVLISAVPHVEKREHFCTVGGNGK